MVPQDAHLECLQAWGTSTSIVCSYMVVSVTNKKVLNIVVKEVSMVSVICNRLITVKVVPIFTTVHT